MYRETGYPKHFHASRPVELDQMASVVLFLCGRPDRIVVIR
jgi:hypothetical protein